MALIVHHDNFTNILEIPDPISIEKIDNLVYNKLVTENKKIDDDDVFCSCSCLVVNEENLILFYYLTLKRSNTLHLTTIGESIKHTKEQKNIKVHKLGKSIIENIINNDRINNDTDPIDKICIVHLDTNNPDVNNLSLLKPYELSEFHNLKYIYDFGKTITPESIQKLIDSVDDLVQTHTLE